MYSIPEDGSFYRITELILERKERKNIQQNKPERCKMPLLHAKKKKCFVNR